MRSWRAARVASVRDTRRASPRVAPSPPAPRQFAPALLKGLRAQADNQLAVKGSMKHAPAIVAALCTLGLALQAAPVRGQDYPRLALHGRLYGNGYPLTLGGTIQ